jgi:pimeloyl-ACP methyl ester carboxylesterase
VCCRFQFIEIGGIPRRTEDNPRRYRSPSEYQVPFESHMIRCEDGVHIHAWLLLRSPNNFGDIREGKSFGDVPPAAATTTRQPPTKTDLPTIVFFHGNAGNIGLRLPNALQMLQFLNANVLMVEYRGYGNSDTVPINEAGLKLDAEAALRFISKHPRIDSSRIFLFGRSLGGAVSFHLAQYAERKDIPLAGVIVENTFLSISHMVDHLMPYLTPIKAIVLRMRWNSYSIVPHLHTPILYLAGDADKLVPHEHMLQLYKLSKASRCLRMHIIVDGTHNESWLQGGQEYWENFRSFLGEAIRMNEEAVVAGTIGTSGSSGTVPPLAAAVTIPIMRRGGSTVSNAEATPGPVTPARLPVSKKDM